MNGLQNTLAVSLGEAEPRTIVTLAEIEAVDQAIAQSSPPSPAIIVTFKDGTMKSVVYASLENRNSELEYLNNRLEENRKYKEQNERGIRNINGAEIRLTGMDDGELVRHRGIEESRNKIRS